MKFIVDFKAQLALHSCLQSPSFRIRWNNTKSDDVIHLWCKLRHGNCRRNRCWVKRSLWPRRGSEHLAARNKERGRVMGVAGDEPAMFLCPPWQLPNSQDCAAPREGIWPFTCALPVIPDPYSCAWQCPAASMLHVAHELYRASMQEGEAPGRRAQCRNAA